jgi:branched-chain amino acid transport system ATP-binding protein
MLKVTGLHAAYGSIQALRGISLEVAEGQIVCLIGGNGAGKSTTLMTICGVVKPKEGTVEFLGQRLDQLSPHQIVQAGISQAPEGRRIFSRLTVQENLDLGAYHRRDKENIGEDLKRCFTLFPILRERRRQKGGTLSGGEQQMLAIARALMARPKVLLLDEPSLGLAPKVVDDIFRILEEINQQGTTVFLVEQNAQRALTLAHKGYVMETGKIVLADESKKLLENEGVRKAYLGE